MGKTSIFRRVEPLSKKEIRKLKVKRYATMVGLSPLLALSAPYFLTNYLVSKLHRHEHAYWKLRKPIRRFAWFLMSGDVITKNANYDLFYDSGKFKNEKPTLENILAYGKEFTDEFHEKLPKEYTELQYVKSIEKDMDELFQNGDFTHIDDRLVPVDSSGRTRYILLNYFGLKDLETAQVPKQRMKFPYKINLEDSLKITIPTYIKESNGKTKLVLGNYEVHMEIPNSVASLDAVITHEARHIYNVFDFMYRVERVAEIENKPWTKVMIESLKTDEAKLAGEMVGYVALLKDAQKKELKDVEAAALIQLKNIGEKFILGRQVKYFSWKMSKENLNLKELKKFFDVPAMIDLENGIEAVVDFTWMETLRSDISEYALSRVLMMPGSRASKSKVIHRFKEKPEKMIEILFSYPTFSEIASHSRKIKRSDFEKRYRKRYLAYLAERIVPAIAFMPIAYAGFNELLINSLALKYSSPFSPEWESAKAEAQLDSILFGLENPAIGLLSYYCYRGSSAMSSYFFGPAIALGIHNRVSKIVMRSREKKSARETLETEINEAEIDIKIGKSGRWIGQALKYIYDQKTTAKPITEEGLLSAVKETDFDSEFDRLHQNYIAGYYSRMLKGESSRILKDMKRYG